MTSGSDSNAIVWKFNGAKFELLSVFKHKMSEVKNVDWKNNLEFATSAGNVLYLWNIEKDEPNIKVQDKFQEIKSIKWDPKGALIYAIYDGGYLNVWSPSSAAALMSFTNASICEWILDKNGMSKLITSNDV